MNYYSTTKNETKQNKYWSLPTSLGVFLPDSFKTSMLVWIFFQEKFYFVKNYMIQICQIFYKMMEYYFILNCASIKGNIRSINLVMSIPWSSGSFAHSLLWWWVELLLKLFLVQQHKEFIFFQLFFQNEILFCYNNLNNKRYVLKSSLM